VEEGSESEGGMKGGIVLEDWQKEARVEERGGREKGGGRGERQRDRARGYLVIQPASFRNQPPERNPEEGNSPNLNNLFMISSLRSSASLSSLALPFVPSSSFSWKERISS
jgi:hypothetical protein